jgi:hypothetical protein
MNRRKAWKGEKVKGDYIKAQAIEIGRLGKKEKPTKPTKPRPKSSPKPSHLELYATLGLWKVSGTEKTTSGCEGAIGEGGAVDADSVATGWPRYDNVCVNRQGET